MLKYPCLVLDHDDTVVQSEATVNYPFFCYILNQFRPGTTITLHEYTEGCFRLGFADMCRKWYNFTEQEIVDEYHGWQKYIVDHIPAPFPGIGDIIRLSELDEGGELPTETVDLLPLAQEAAENLRAAAEAKNVSIIVSGENAPVIGVRRLLYEIAYNLCDNAIKYNVDGGSVDVRVGAEGGSACLTVRDTGIGIAPEDRERIFERIVKLETFPQGTGLGQSICKSIAEQLGSSVGVDSVAGEGSSFRIDIPAGE